MSTATVRVSPGNNYDGTRSLQIPANLRSPWNEVSNTRIRIFTGAIGVIVDS